jgi:hypothetical protein
MITREIQGTANRQKLIDMRIPIGAAGAVGTVVGKGIVSVTRNSAGKLTVVLDKGWATFLGMSWGLSGVGAPGPVDGRLSVDVSNLNAATPSVIIYTALTAAPTTAADVASGTTLNVQLHVSDSDV